MKPPSTRRHARRALALLAAASLAGLASAGDGGYTLKNGTTASGGAVASNDCYALVSTVGEPAAGTVSDGTYRITSGFPATVGTSPISTGTFTLFKDSFEGNDQEGCTP